jgi:hypothetical protein
MTFIFIIGAGMHDTDVTRSKAQAEGGCRAVGMALRGRLSGLVLMAVVTTLSACASDDSDHAPGKPSEGPLYIVHSTIDTDDVRMGYLVTTPSIEGDVDVDVTQGIEIPGGGYMYSPPEGDFVLIGGSEAPTFTRYALGGDGRLEQGKTMSLAGVGVNRTYRHVIFVNESQAYFLDESQIQIVRFNPTTMEIDHVIPVDDFKCPEVETTFGTPIRREDGFYFPRGCWDQDVTSSGTSLVHLDPETDEVTVTQEERCMGLQVGFLADSGHAYWFSDHDASVEWTFQRRDAPHDCALRLRAGESTFDPDWELDLRDRTGGVSAVAAAPGRASKIWLKVFEPAAFAGTVPVDEIAWGLKAWRWGVLDVESDDPVDLDEDADLAVFYGYPITFEGRAFSPLVNEDFSRSTLVELTDSGVKARVKVQGTLRKIFRLR